jgi:hypothetical protein
MRWIFLLACLSCGTTLQRDYRKTPPLSPERQMIVKTAQQILKTRNYKVEGFRFDENPLGFVRACYWAAGIELYDPRIRSKDGLEILYRSATLKGFLHYKTAFPGDLIFFDMPSKKDTYPGFVAIVEKADKDKPIRIIGYFGNGLKRVELDLRNPKNSAKINGSEARLGELLRVIASPF